MLSNRPSIPWQKVFQMMEWCLSHVLRVVKYFSPAHIVSLLVGLGWQFFVLVWLLAVCLLRDFHSLNLGQCCPVRTKTIPCRGSSRFPKVILPVSLRTSPCLLVGKCSVLELILIRRAAVAWVLPIRKLDFTPIHFQCLRHGLERKYFWYLRVLTDTSRQYQRPVSGANSSGGYCVSV